MSTRVAKSTSPASPPKERKERQRRPLPWTPEQVLALRQIFEGRKTLDEIALDCAATPPRTLDDWIAHPDFQVRLTEMRNNLLESLTSMGISYVRKEQRIIGLSQMAESARREYEQRPWLKEERQIGRDAETGEPLLMTNESFNRDAHAAFRASLDDIAKELGQRTSKVDVTSEGTALQAVFVLPHVIPLPEAHVIDANADDD